MEETNRNNPKYRELTYEEEMKTIKAMVDARSGNDENHIGGEELRKAIIKFYSVMEHLEEKKIDVKHEIQRMITKCCSTDLPLDEIVQKVLQEIDTIK